MAGSGMIGLIDSASPPPFRGGLPNAESQSLAMPNQQGQQREESLWQEDGAIRQVFWMSSPNAEWHQECEGRR